MNRTIKLGATKMTKRSKSKQFGITFHVQHSTVYCGPYASYQEALDYLPVQLEITENDYPGHLVTYSIDELI